MMNDIITIRASDLRKGMQTYRRNSRNGRLVRDVQIGDPFTHSGSIQDLAFYTVAPNGKRSGIARYDPCATVLVGTNAGSSRRNKRR